MTTAIEKRICRAEVAFRTNAVPTIEDALFALDRLDRPPLGYTDEQRASDENTLYRWGEDWERRKAGSTRDDPITH
jgi:hypothetical protein